MYREHAVTPALERIAACTWQHTSDVTTRASVVPDACVDIIWDGKQLRVAGPDTKPVQVAMHAGTSILGLRFVPGAAGALLGAPVSAVRDARVELRELWGEAAQRVEHALQAAGDAEAALAALQAAVVERVATSGPIDRVASAVAAALQPGPVAGGDVRPLSVAQLSAAVGVSERQLLRRCDAAFGYGPKVLARVLRFQGFVRALRTDTRLSLAELAAALGYADQAHLAHETAELAGRTPSQLRARSAP
jgi:AraC-like DNA-binding protein